MTRSFLRPTRRHFLASLAATTALPRWALAQNAEPDIAIVGAGAAGIGAALACIEQGLSFVMIEAKDRIGGRAHTDLETFGTPFDRGCSWLHHGDINPFTEIAERDGFTLLNHDGNRDAAFIGDRRLSEAEDAAYGAAWDETIAELSRIGRQGRDEAPAPHLPAAPPWSDMVRGWLGPLSAGVDVEDFSAADWWSLEDTNPDLLIREGFGALVAHTARDLPVSLSTPATRIAWNGAGESGVTIETPQGTIRAKACILTVSTGVLQAERIRFDPPLPNDKLRAIDGLPMGLLAKIPLQFAGAGAESGFGLEANDWLSYASANIGAADPAERRLCYFLTWPFDNDLLIGFVGGRFGYALSQEVAQSGVGAAVDFALGELKSIFGGAIEKHFVKGDFTRWADDPEILGGYAYQRPGAAGARAGLAEPLDERLFFAGEATAEGYAMTCGGAFWSGQRAVEEAAEAVGAE